MTKRQLQMLKNRSQVKVATPAYDNQINFAMLVTFAFAFAGIALIVLFVVAVVIADKIPQFLALLVQTGN